MNEARIWNQKCRLNARLLDLCRYGILQGTLDDVKGLIDMGADINYQDSDGQSLLIILCTNNIYTSNHTETNHNYNYNTNTNNLKLLLESGADVDIQNEYGNTALMHSLHDINIMKLLLKYDPDINLVNVLNENALEMCEGSEYNKPLLEQRKLLEEYIKKKLVIVQKRLLLGKLFYSSLGENMMEEALYEQISSLV